MEDLYFKNETVKIIFGLAELEGKQQMDFLRIRNKGGNMKRIIEKINEALKERKNTGYLEIYLDNNLVAHFATKETLKNDGIEMPNGMIFFENKYLPNIAKTIKSIAEAKKVVTRGGYYNKGFMTFLVEEIRFYKDIEREV